MMKTTKTTTTMIRHGLVALPLLALAACGGARPATRPDPMEGLIAMAPVSTDSPGAYRHAMRPQQPSARFPEQTLRDPAERFALIERLRTQVVSQTRHMPSTQWRTEA